MSESKEVKGYRNSSKGTTAKYDKSHEEQRLKILNELDKERHFIATQCGTPCADTETSAHGVPGASACGPFSNVLFHDFRFDIICRSLEIFKEKGLDLKQLMELQKKLPISYAWNIEYDALRQDVNRRFVVFPLAIVMAKTSQDVRKAFRFAFRHKIQVTLRGGAHS